ncbi:HNH endonuclease [Pseudonocardiaceae bacterium YIM PH 21723]|nr:HNH endonuclease [Pseudonocardiaceae bacterium YIM PH 21723]
MGENILLSIADTVSADPRSLTPTQLHAREEVLFQARTIIEAALIDTIGVMDSRGTTETTEVLPTRQWLRARHRTSWREAKDLVALSHALKVLPLTDKLFKAGEITLAHVQVIARGLNRTTSVTRAGFLDAEHIYSELARVETPEKVEWAIRYLLAQLDPDAEDEKALDRYEKRGLDFFESDGFTQLRGYLDPNTGAKVKAAIDAVMKPPTADDQRTASQRRADALGEVCDRALRGDSLPSSGGQRAQVNITCTLSELMNTGALTGQAVIDGVGAIDPETLRRIACDCNVSRILLGPKGEVLDVGRSTRVAPVALRRALTLRDQHCSWDGCEAPARYCDVHHVEVHWAHGGETNLKNCGLYCGHHHTAIHTYDTVTVRRPDGGFLTRLRR